MVVVVKKDSHYNRRSTHYFPPRRKHMTNQPGTGGEFLQGTARRMRSYETKKVTEIKSISMHGVQKN